MLPIIDTIHNSCSERYKTTLVCHVLVIQRAFDVQFRNYDLTEHDIDKLVKFEYGSELKPTVSLCHSHVLYAGFVGSKPTFPLPAATLSCARFTFVLIYCVMTFDLEVLYTVYLFVNYTFYYINYTISYFIVQTYSLLLN